MHTIPKYNNTIQQLTPSALFFWGGRDLLGTLQKNEKNNMYEEA